MYPIAHFDVYITKKFHNGIEKIGTYSIVLFVPQTIRHWFHDTKFINLEYDRTKVYGGAGGGGAVRVKSANL